MPTVYRVFPDSEEFHSIRTDDVESVSQYRFDGSRIKDIWVPPAAYSPFPTQLKCLSFCFTFLQVVAETGLRGISFKLVDENHRVHHLLGLG